MSSLKFIYTAVWLATVLLHPDPYNGHLEFGGTLTGHFAGFPNGMGMP